jgi:hypothetical protein
LQLGFQLDSVAHTKSTTCILIYELRKVRLAPAFPERNYEYCVRRGESVRVLQRHFLGFESVIAPAALSSVELLENCVEINNNDVT